MLVKYTWNIYTSKLELSGQFQPSTVSKRDYLKVLTGNTSELQHETVSNFLKALFTEPISSVKWLPVTYFAGFIIIIALVIITRIFLKKSFSKGEAINIGITLSLGTIGYACIMAVSYAFFFNEVEMKILASYGRYMSIYLTGAILFLVWVLIYHLSLKTKIFTDVKKVIPIAVASVLLFDPMNVRFILPQGLREDIRAPYRKDAEYIASITSPDEKIFVIYDNEKVSPHWWGAYQAYLQYFLNDRTISKRALDSFSYDYHDPATKTFFTDIIDECGSIYIRDVNPEFNDAFGINTPEGQFEDNTVYKIVHEPGNITFIKN